MDKDKFNRPKLSSTFLSVVKVVWIVAITFGVIYNSWNTMVIEQSTIAAFDEITEFINDKIEEINTNFSISAENDMLLAELIEKRCTKKKGHYTQSFTPDAMKINEIPNLRVAYYYE